MQPEDQVACRIAHDFNNLLTAVIGAAESAGAHPDLPPEVVDELAHIRVTARRGADLVRRLLEPEQEQASRSRVLPLNGVVSDVAPLLRRLLGRQIHLDLELDETAGRVRADPTQLERVLVNLAVNACDAMPRGGRLIVRTGHMTSDRARYVRLEVTDTGHGIPHDILPHIFEPFFTTRRERGGTGLGLSTVRDIVRESGGFLEIESVPGKGTTLRMGLPRADDRVAAEPRDLSIANPQVTNI